MPFTRKPVSIQGTSGKTSYFLSFGYNKEEGVITFNPNKLKKYNATMNVTSDITDWLTVGGRFSYNDKVYTEPSTRRYTFQYQSFTLNKEYYMKRFNYIIGVGLLSLATLTGCDSILDKGPLDKFTNDNFWTSASNVEGYANTFYNEFTEYGNGGGSSLFYYKTLSDDQAGNSFADWSQKDNLTTNGTWKSPYIENRRANIMLENIPKISENDAIKNHWLGMGRLIRAYEYFQLVRMFSDIPYTDKALDITDEGIIYGARTNHDEIMDKVLDNLNFATENINDVSSKITWSRSMANAMKTDICLYEGTFRKYRSASDGQPAPRCSRCTEVPDCLQRCLYSYYGKRVQPDKETTTLLT